MALLMVLAAHALSAPLQVKTSQTNAAPYPSEFLLAEKSAGAVLELIISPEGKVVQCRTLQAYGDQVFALRLCKLQNARSWASATDENGARAYGIVRTLSRMFVPATKQGDEIAALARIPDLVISVSALPKSATSYLDVKVSLWVDTSGNVTQCAPRPEQSAPAAYLTLACEEARTLPRFEGALLDGKPLPGFAIEQTIRFTAQAK